MPPAKVIIRHENGTKFMTVQLGPGGLEDVETHSSGSFSDAQDILDLVSRAFFERPVTLEDLIRAKKARVKQAS